MGNKNWTQEECDYLEAKWGMISIPSIATALGRTINGIKIKAFKLGLGRHLHCGTEITVNELANALGKGSSYSWILDRWCRYGLPVNLKKSINKKYKVIEIDDFWKWAEVHKDMLDFSEFEVNMLGKEPKWVEEKRKNDIAAARYKKTPWTKEEDNSLISMINSYKYSYREISERLKRTEGAIQRRVIDLGIKARPLKAENHTKWTEEEHKILTEMIKNRTSYELMPNRINKSSKAIRGKVFNMYLTENLDKVAAMIGNGTWGDGRPERPITHRLLNVAEKDQVKIDMTKFVGMLKGIICSHYDSNDYWQREMCMKWDNVCTAGETDCDSCTSFVRIKPQYCRRCGATILNRKQVTFCDKCLVARKKQYQRKYMALHGGNINTTEAMAIKGGNNGQARRILSGGC